ncbi:MAG: endonuclease III [Pseudomonadota bacterium]
MSIAIKRNKGQIEEIFHRLQEHNPDPRSDLEYTSTYTLLVAVVLSAQATDAGVNKATRRLFPIASTPEEMVALGMDGIKNHIKTIGLFNAKAQNVYALSQKLIADHNSAVPGTHAELQALPGVGRKTANVVLNIAFGQNTLAVDTHVFRLSHRLGLATGKTPDAVERELLACVPDHYLYHAHHWLILHGRYVCKAQKPLCPTCILNDVCGFKEKRRPG